MERFIGSLRRECLDHMIGLNEQHLRRVLSVYARYYNGPRIHLSLARTRLSLGSWNGKSLER
ncbi:MAG: integrase core domain-containing protein [Candidatus Binatia bacterium]|nr:integrase core domain-containing protein [Candidatus Binatia bacterium]